MATPFGPQLIGETEKTLNALLQRVLDGRLTERQWVTLRVAATLGDDDDLAAAVAERAHFADAPVLVTGLTRDGLLAQGRLTDAGRALVAELQDEIAALVAPVWGDLSAVDVDVTGRVLNTVLARARAVLAG